MPRTFLSAVAFALLGSICAAQSDITQVAWKLSVRLAEQRFQIDMHVQGLKRDKLVVAMPVWRAGSYQTWNFSKAVQNLRQVDDQGRETPLGPPTQHAWTVATNGQATVHLRYDLPTKPPKAKPPKNLPPEIYPKGIGKNRILQLPAKQPGKPERIRHYRQAYAFEGRATWLFIPGRRRVPQRVHFQLPDGWDVATGMQPAADQPYVFACPDYDTLADCPFHLGSFRVHTFDIDDRQHRLVLSGFAPRPKVLQQLADRLTKIARAQQHGIGKPPYRHYTFLVQNSRTGYAGYAHRNSSSLELGYLSIPRAGSNAQIDAQLAEQLYQCWNASGLRYMAAESGKLRQPPRTRALWLYEGFASYYAALSCVRAGLWKPQTYWLRNIAHEINTLQRNAGRKRISVADASHTVWTSKPSRVYRQQAPSYRNKGALIALLLDIEIRDATNGQKSLDDVQRGLFKHCMDLSRGFADGDVRKQCERTTGRSFESFFADYVDGTEELPFKKVLAKIGLDAGPMVSKKKHSRASKRQDGKRRRRPRRWAVSFHPKASTRAVALRKAMTRVVVPD